MFMDSKFSFVSVPLQAPTPRLARHASPLEAWLDGLPPTRSQSAPVPRRRVEDHSRRPPTCPPDSMSGHQRLAANNLPTPASTDYTSRSNESGDAARQNNRVKSSTYRLDALEPNGLHFVRSGPLPDCVGQKVDAIIYAPRHSPPMARKRAVDINTSIQDLVDALEERLRDYMIPHLAPQVTQYPHAQMSLGMAFKESSIPRDRTVPVKPVGPKPDQTYGYSRGGTEDWSTWALQRGSDGQSAIHLTDIVGDIRSPFFIWEYKAQVSGGTLYHAVSQAIAGGSACVQAARALAHFVGESYEKPADAIAFSVAIDNVNAQLLVHWYSPLDYRYKTQAVRTFNLYDRDRLPQLINVAKNIVSHGYGQRYSEIMKHLSTLFSASSKTVPTQTTATKRSFTQEHTHGLHQLRIEQHTAWLQARQAPHPSPYSSSHFSASTQLNPQSVYQRPLSVPYYSPTTETTMEPLPSGTKRRCLDGQ